MVHLTLLGSLLLASRTVQASFQNGSQPFDSHHPLKKRWYSVPQLGHPPMTLDNEDTGGFGPWPVSHQGAGMHMIRYCFENARSYQRLNEIVDAALVKWQPALYPHSSVTIGFDTLLNRRAKLCTDQGISAEALRIVDDTKDDDDKYNWGECVTGSESTGFDYNSHKVVRHRLEFCELKPGFEAKLEDRAILKMAHELGHALGLLHEHQRPDIRKYLAFECERLAGFAEGVRNCKSDEYGMNPDEWEELENSEDPEEREKCDRLIISAICTEEQWANAYFPGAREYVTAGHMDTQAARWNAAVTGPFDYDSIMIYSSFVGAAKEDPSDPKTWVQWRKGSDQPVWQGGNPVFEKAGPTELDVERVKQLYPLLKL